MTVHTYRDLANHVGGADRAATACRFRSKRSIKIDGREWSHLHTVAGRAESVLYVDDVEASLPANCHVQAWRPKVEGISEVFHAQISDYSYPAHCHDTWTILIVDHGAIRYDLELDGESRLALIQHQFEQHLNSRRVTKLEPESGVAHRLRHLLDEDTTEAIGLDEAANILDRSKAHLIRSFSATFGVSPHAYVVSRRVEAARNLLLAGRPVAEVAATTGFHDQPHLTRHFKRYTSVTPGRYAANHG